MPLFFQFQPHYICTLPDFLTISSVMLVTWSTGNHSQIYWYKEWWWDRVTEWREQENISGLIK